MKNHPQNLSAWMIYFDTRHEPAATIAANLSAHIFPENAAGEALAAVRQYLSAHGYPPKWALSPCAARPTLSASATGAKPCHAHTVP